MAAMRNSDARANLVVRQHAPTRRYIIAGAILVLAAFAFYIVYELGRFNAGYDRLEVAQQRTELEVEIERLGKTNRELRTQLAELDTIRIGRAREQAEVARNIGDLQGQVAHQTQELAFYRGVVAQGAVAVGVKVQQLHISAGAKPQKFVLHIALVRSVRPDNVAIGTVGLSVDGATGDGKAATVDLSAITTAKLRELPFNFRYFENVDQDVALPAGFKPEHIDIEVRSSKKDVAPASQSFPWNIDAS
jgi:cell division protein FtsB